MPILVTGSWVKGGREVSFTRAELEQAIENFQKLANHDLNVDYDHACEDLERAAGDPTPSAGRIVALDEPEEYPGKELRTGESADGKRYILYGRYEPTERARQLIKNREYRYTSAAFVKDYPDRQTGESQGLTLTSVALTNQPFLDELPEIWLSIERPSSLVTGPLPPATGQGPGITGEGQRTKYQGQNSDSTRLAAANSGGNEMADTPNLTLKHHFAADNKTHVHEAYDGDKKVGEIEHEHLKAHAEQFCGGQSALSAAAGTDTETLARKSIERFTAEIGVEGKSAAEIRGLVTLALNPPKAEVTLLSECITAEGRLDQVKLNALDDSSAIARSGYRRAMDAEQRVDRAYQKGQITPAMLVTGAPLRLALSDGAAFKALIEDRPGLVKPNVVTGIGGTGAETGESPRVLFAKLVEEKKQQLMLADTRLSELDAHRKAGALVAKENPDLLKNYRADSTGPARA